MCERAAIVPLPEPSMQDKPHSARPQAATPPGDGATSWRRSTEPESSWPAFEERSAAAPPESSSSPYHAQDDQEHYRSHDSHPKTRPFPSFHAGLHELIHQESAQHCSNDAHNDVQDHAYTAARQKAGHQARQATEDDPRQNTHGRTSY